MLYDLNGKTIDRVTDEMQPPGFHQEIIGNEPNLAPGTYLLKINIDGTLATLPILKFLKKNA